MTLVLSRLGWQEYALISFFDEFGRLLFRHGGMNLH